MIMLNTRVTSARNASACRSNISFVCSSNRVGDAQSAVPAARCPPAGPRRSESAARPRAPNPGTRPASPCRPCRGWRSTRAASARTESRMLPWLRCASLPCLGAAAVAEEALEHPARMRLGGVRRGGVPPRHRVHVEAVARIAGALRREVHGQLDRRQARRPADRVGNHLVDRRGEAHLDARQRAVVGVHAGQPHGGGAWMVARAVAERVGLPVRQSAQDVDVLAHRRERLQRGREIVARAGRGRDPLVLDDAVRRCRRSRSAAWASGAARPAPAPSRRASAARSWRPSPAGTSAGAVLSS